MSRDQHIGRHGYLRLGPWVRLEEGEDHARQPTLRCDGRRRRSVRLLLAWHPLRSILSEQIGRCVQPRSAQGLVRVSRHNKSHRLLQQHPCFSVLLSTLR
jgi:hypothetical protein